MGVQGLLKALRPLFKRGVHINDCFEGRVSVAAGGGKNLKRERTVAIDASAWLHRGAYNCAMDLGRGKPTVKYADFFMRENRHAEIFQD